MRDGFYVPHGLGEDTVRYCQFRAWLADAHEQRRRMLHIVGGKQGVTVFAMTPEVYRHFPNDKVVRTTVQQQDVA